MSSWTMMKWAALVGLSLSAVFLCAHFPLFDTGESIALHQTSITGWLYRRFCSPERLPYAEHTGEYEATGLQNNSYIFVRIQERIHEMTNLICDFAVDAGLLNAILVIPEITSCTSSKGISDSGNNNFLHTVVKVNYKPYGIDYPSGVTGRFTNGKTFVDLIAQFLGLPSAPPYMGLSTNDKINITTGVNYASGSAGILMESGTAEGENLCFEKQIKYFQDTVTTDLLSIFKTPTEVLKYLSKSILVISIGSNDYINNYLKPAVYQSSQLYTPPQFADYLLNLLVQGLKKLYSLGGRKFLVFNIGQIGCVPMIANSVTPELNTLCVEDVNDMVLLYDNRLRNILRKLESTLVGSTFVHGDAYNLKKLSSGSGQNPCCAVGVDGLCLPDQTPCQDRDKYSFWDGFHPTEVVNRNLAKDCFNGSFSCVPLNVQQLAQKH
ncbi:hypothetical protein IFM89_033397 [Coptis chinensis]|uniref:Uncharacterized protein n=1 Tax=Coptis chinensis TaxID=261450 RepID=A0A835HUG2_9MAGN|nr:hypothetical protein IFM89_033397 [Coptis chinensis]